VAGAAIAGYALSRALRFFNKAIPQDMQIVVVPMPITSARRRERGYNQCDLIINELEKTVEFDVENRITYVRDLLIRVRHTSRQTLKDRTDRLESIHGIFAVNESAASLPEMRRDPLRYFIVVIDDVITTGSTIKDAIKTFRKAGFENTYGLSVAH
jgi:predicted amidophosphoribosyltransferase